MSAQVLNRHLVAIVGQRPVGMPGPIRQFAAAQVKVVQARAARCIFVVGRVFGLSNESAGYRNFCPSIWSFISPLYFRVGISEEALAPGYWHDKIVEMVM